MAKRKEVRDQDATVLPAAGDPAPMPPEAIGEAETARTETPASDPIQTEPTRIEPTRIETLRTEPAMSDFVKPASIQPGLPMMESPNLDGSAPIAASDESATAAFPDLGPAAAAASDAATSEQPAGKSRVGASRFAMLAASIAIAAAVGAFVGSLGAAGVARLSPAAAVPVAVSHNPAAPQVSAEIAALKANIDAASRSANAQIAKIAERIDRAERAQADPAAKIARISDAVDRLEKRTIAAATPAAPAAPEITGSITPPSAPAAVKPADRVLDGWVVHQVTNGRALVESRYGNMFEISAGGFLPGVGRVEQIKRQDGHWLVITARGVIESYH